MKKTYAVVLNEEIVNVVTGTDEWAATQSGIEEIPTTPGSPGKGWKRVNGVWTAPVYSND